MDAKLEKEEPKKETYKGEKCENTTPDSELNIIVKKSE
jgi:hypothetical protein